jgi:AhpD family alkylhydroperoxidase
MSKSTHSRLEYVKIDPAARDALLEVETYVERTIEQSRLELSLADLVRLRASQLNGCAFCIDMHIKDAIASGETEQRLYMLTAWREANCYTDRERAALALTEAVTLVAESRVPDDVYEEARQQFSEKELVALTMAIVAINSWNRMNVTFRRSAGNYKSTRVKQQTAEAVQ